MASSQSENASKNAKYTSSQAELVDTKITGGRYWSSLEKILLVLVMIFFVGFIIFVALYASKLSDDDDSTTSVKKVTNGNKSQVDELCFTSNCIGVSAKLMSSMNFSANPCEDFYNYACGGWERDNEIPDTESMWGQFDILNLANDNVLKKLVNNPKTKAAYKNNAAVKKALRYYETCMNREKINSQGAQPLHDLIKAYYSWNVTGNGTWNAASWDFTKTMVDMQRNISISPFFIMFTGADYYNSTVNVIKVDQDGLGMTRDIYLSNQTDQEKIQKAYQTLMIKTVALLGAEGEDAKRQMMDVYDLEKQIAETTIPIVEKRNIDQHYKKMTIRELINYTGDQIGWLSFFKNIFDGLGYKMTNDSIVVVYALDYLKNISLLIKNTDKTIVANYMMWRVVSGYMSELSEDFKKIILEYKKAKSGTVEEEPQWRQCLSSTAGAFGMPLGLLYINEKFSGGSKEKIMQLIREIREIFISNLDSVEWMDDKTRKSATEKANAILENIGYPDYLKNNTALDKKYDGLQPTDDHFKNVLKKSAFFMKQYYENIKKPVNKKEWSMDPQVVNAYYSSTKNKIVFPAGILQSPFYNKDRPRALNYGGIGAVVGHEITHGFDDNGRRFNKNGNLVKWWSNHSIEAFKNKTKCLIDQYSSYKFFGENVQGAQTVGENIADNGGVKQAYQAYQTFKKNYGDEGILPGLNATNDQLFFLGFAQVWCGKFRKQAALNQIKNGVHTPGKYRVIGTLSNSEYFAKAFNCPRGTRMNPENKCGVW
ncbi:endothelin-converting enzyme homolog isoform X2 [Dendronephthya gigantea]|uniref:endothelin-converting enzyme homolog isoform X2 n=1 Tax=Dendronephthya gigantea TaxID=151771 RepID=UPI00106A4AFF|nr:endothelin-converting enzyme homolog isoform X2 [Dendronephthya gigantea]